MSDRRTEILEATCRVIGRAGVHELRVEDVAKEVGISPALVYYYFDTRADLLSRAFEFADARSMTATLAEVDLEAPAGQQIHDILIFELADVPEVHDSWVIWSEMTAGAVFDEDLRRDVTKWTNHWVKIITDLVIKGQEDGSVGSGVEPESAAQRLTAAVDSLGSRALLHTISHERAQELLEETIRLELGSPG